MRSMLLALDPPQLELGVRRSLRVAVAAGARRPSIGLERELDEKAAGLRTHMLVSVGAALFTLVGAYGFTDFSGAAASTRPGSPPRSSPASASSAPA